MGDPEKFLKDGVLPEDNQRARELTLAQVLYEVIDDVLYHIEPDKLYYLQLTEKWYLMKFVVGFWVPSQRYMTIG